MSVDFAGVLRRRKPEKRQVRLKPCRSDELTGVGDLGAGRVALVPDTNVYINDAAGRLSPEVEALLDRALLFHCSVCVAELATGVANGDPSHRRWRATRDHYAGLAAAISPSRLLTPDAEIWAHAGVIAGTLARTQAFQAHGRKECVNDALILLTAMKAGLPVLTANRDEFDLNPTNRSRDPLSPVCVTNQPGRVTRCAPDLRGQSSITRSLALISRRTCNARGSEPSTDRYSAGPSFR